jgi:hypothetical protein
MSSKGTVEHVIVFEIIVSEARAVGADHVESPGIRLQ